jgi:hypothetical protein
MINICKDDWEVATRQCHEIGLNRQYTHFANNREQRTRLLRCCKIVDHHGEKKK